MTAYKIENFFGHLDAEQTFLAVCHGLTLLDESDARRAILTTLTPDELAELSAGIEDVLRETEGGRR